MTQPKTLKDRKTLQLEGCKYITSKYGIDLRNCISCEGFAIEDCDIKIRLEEIDFFETILKNRIEREKEYHNKTCCNIWKCKHWYLGEQLRQILGDD